MGIIRQFGERDIRNDSEDPCLLPSTRLSATAFGASSGRGPPHDERWQEQGYVDKAVWKKAGEHGFLCMSMPEEYGGSGADKLFSVVLMEEQARINNSSLGWGLHSEIVAPYLFNYGSEALKKKYLPKMAAGEMIGAIAMSEPGAGSDLQAIKTTAIRKAMALRFEWIKDIHHQRLELRPGDRGGKDRSCQGREGHEPGRRRYVDEGLCQGQAAEENGPEGTGHGRAVLRQRRSASGEPARPGEQRLHLPDAGTALGADADRDRRGAKCRSRARLDASTTCNERKAFGKPVAELPEHALQAGRARDRGPGDARVRRPLHGTAAGKEARHRDRLDGQVLGHRPGGQGDRRMPAAARRLRLHVGIPDLAGLRGRARDAHLRRHQ